MHAYPFTHQSFGNFSMAIQAERYNQLGIMRFTDYVMILKETM